MISFVDSLPDNNAKNNQHIQYLYAFALERFVLCFSSVATLYFI